MFCTSEVLADLKFLTLMYNYSYFCFQTVDEAMRRNASNTYPYAICIGSESMFTSSVIVCNKKVITEELGQLVFSVILSLLCTHYAFELAYNPISQQVMEFLQEKLLGDRVSGVRTTAYSNLFRALGCLEQQIDEHAESDCDNIDDTQEFCDY